MSKLARMSGKELSKILERIGFEMIQGKGSHLRLKHPDGRRTVIPIHGNEKIGKGLLKEILKQVKLSREEFEKLL
jgi:predicted RNA binding protein YcfA (HicA-like mRNA interferase family)